MKINCPFCGGSDISNMRCLKCGTTWGKETKHSHKTNAFYVANCNNRVDSDSNGGWSNAAKAMEQ